MKTTELKASPRETIGKKENKRLRREDKIPAVIYKKDDVQHIYLDYKPTAKVIFTPETYIFNLNVDGETVEAVVKEVQYHPVKDTIEHIDFLKLTPGQPVTLTLPIKLKGTAVGVTKGGKLMQILRKVTVKGDPKALPEKLEIDVSALEMGQTRKVSEVDFGEIKVLTSPSTGIAAIEIPRTLRSAQAAAKKD